MTAILLLTLGLLLLFLEFFMPGGILGGAGAIAILVAIFIFLAAENSPIVIFGFIIAVIVAVVAVVQGALWIIRKRSADTFYSAGDQEGYFASSWSKELVGRKGIVSSDLKPGGYIAIEGEEYSAISLNGYVKRGESVEVVGGEGDSLHVTKNT